MRIAIITDVFYPYIAGGAEKRYFEIAKRLAKSNEIHIYTQQWNNFKKEEVFKNIHIHRLNRVNDLYVKTGRRKITPAILFSIKLFFKLFTSKRFDIIECNLFPYFPCFVGKFFSILKRNKFVILFHEVWGAYWYSYFKNEIFSIIGRVIEIISSRLTKNIIAYTPTIKNLINRTFKINKKNIFLIPSGVDINLFEKVKKDKKKNQIIFIGRLIPEKRIFILIKALKLIKDPLKLLIIGIGPQKDRLKEIIMKENIHDIKYLGLQNYKYIVRYLSESLIFVLPSIREGQGIVFLESMAAMTPVIGVYKYDSGVKDIIKNNFNGFLVKKDDVNELAEKIKELIDDDKKYKKFQKNGYQFAVHYDWNKISNLVYRYYLYLLNNKKYQINEFKYFWN
ncbi:MAG: glycosyltransferase family 4 protein [Candidatus Helarchaeota archaeon]